MRMHTLLLVVVLFFWTHVSGCGRPKETAVEKHAFGWTLSAAGRETNDHPPRRWRFTYDGRDPITPSRLVTPFCTLAASTPIDAWSDSGWKCVDKRTSAQLPVAEDMAPVDAVKRGFVASDGPRPRDIPLSWVYIVDVEVPGWIAPSLLVSVSPNTWNPRKVRRLPFSPKASSRADLKSCLDVWLEEKERAPLEDLVALSQNSEQRGMLRVVSSGPRGRPMVGDESD